MQHISIDKHLTSYADALVRQSISLDRFNEYMQKSMSHVLSVYLEQGRLDPAIALARNSPFLPPAHIESVISGGTLDNSYPVPFAWQAIRSHHGDFQFDENGKIVINYDGKRLARLARHDLLLQSGNSYSLETQLEHPPQKSDNFYWNINCQDSSKLIGQSRFLEADQSDRIITVFKVPEQDCKAQKITLLADKTSESKYSQLSILNIRIKKVDSSKAVP